MDYHQLILTREKLFELMTLSFISFLKTNSIDPLDAIDIISSGIGSIVENDSKGNDRVFQFLKDSRDMDDPQTYLEMQFHISECVEGAVATRMRNIIDALDPSEENRRINLAKEILDLMHLRLNTPRIPTENPVLSSDVPDRYAKSPLE